MIQLGKLILFEQGSITFSRFQKYQISALKVVKKCDTIS